MKEKVALNNLNFSSLEGDFLDLSRNYVKELCQGMKE